MIEIEKVLISLVMMFICTLIHALFMLAGNRALEWRLARPGPFRSHLGPAVLLWLLTQWMFIAIILEASLWAFLYQYGSDAAVIPDHETAFYFSMVTYTTLGYGDVVVHGTWRTLAAIQAANGVIMFGWTTALIFYFIQRIYRAHRN